MRTSTKVLIGIWVILVILLVADVAYIWVKDTTLVETGEQHVEQENIVNDTKETNMTDETNTTDTENETNRTSDKLENTNEMTNTTNTAQTNTVAVRHKQYSGKRRTRKQ